MTTNKATAIADATRMADKIYRTCLAGLDKFSTEIHAAEQQVQQEEATNQP